MSPVDEASDPGTRAARLLELAEAGDPAVLAAIARNPRATIAALGSVVVALPALACAHPRLVSSGQRSFASWTTAAWLAVAAEPTAPPRLLQLAASRFPSAIVVLLRHDAPEDLRITARRVCPPRPSPSELAEARQAAAGLAAVRRLDLTNRADQIAALCAPGTTAGELFALVEPLAGELTVLVATHPAATEALILALAARRPAWVPELTRLPNAPTDLLLLADPTCSDGEILARLLERGEGVQQWVEAALTRGQHVQGPLRLFRVLQRIAKLPGAEVVARGLAGHADPRWRAEVARFSGPLDAALAARLAADPSPLVRDGVAGRADLPPELGPVLVADPDVRVKCRAAGNPAIPWSTVAPLWNDPDLDVRCAVRRRADVPDGALLGLDQSSVAELLAILDNDRAPSFVVNHLALHADPAVRARAGRHPNLRPAEVEDILFHPNRAIRRNLATHPLTEAAIRVIAQDPDDQVRAALAGRPDVPLDVRGVLATDRSPQVRDAVAKSRSTPPAILGPLATDPNARVRSSVAGNPSAPEEARALARASVAPFR